MQHVIGADGTTVFKLDTHFRTNIIHINRKVYESSDGLRNVEMSNFNL